MEYLPNHIYIYTDGGIKNNGKEDSIGSHAYILLLNDKKFCHSEAQRNSSSNREEMLAILHALQKLNRKDLPVTVFSDSQYCVNGLNLWMKNWKKKNWKSSTNDPVKNRDLWEQLDEIITEFGDLTVLWVRGHDGNEYNEECDRMCQQAKLDFEERINQSNK